MIRDWINTFCFVVIAVASAGLLVTVAHIGSIINVMSLTLTTL